MAAQEGAELRIEAASDPCALLNEIGVVVVVGYLEAITSARSGPIFWVTITSGLTRSRTSVRCPASAMPLRRFAVISLKRPTMVRAWQWAGPAILPTLRKPTIALHPPSPRVFLVASSSVRTIRAR